MNSIPPGVGMMPATTTTTATTHHIEVREIVTRKKKKREKYDSDAIFGTFALQRGGTG
jgi:hypothetical protein